MNIHEITFTLNNKEKIIVEFTEPLSNAPCCYNAPIIFLHNTKQIILSNGNLQDNILELHTLLNKALHNELPLHSSIEKDVGYLYNEYCDVLWHTSSLVKTNFTYTKIENRQIWIGEQYNLWGYDAVTTWIYNTSDGSIIFEITPIYPGGFGDPEKGATSISFTEWMHAYMPYVIKIIPHTVAKQWLEQAHEILKQIEEARKS